MGFLVDETTDSKTLLIQRDGYVIRLEYNEDYVIVHLRDIDKFTKEIFQDMLIQLQDWSDFLKAMGRDYLWAAVPRDNTKIKRLLGGLKFQFVSHKDDLTVYKYEV
jgi:hypothetical protein